MELLSSSDRLEISLILRFVYQTKMNRTVMVESSRIQIVTNWFDRPYTGLIVKVVCCIVVHRICESTSIHFLPATEPIE